MKISKLISFIILIGLSATLVSQSPQTQVLGSWKKISQASYPYANQPSRPNEGLDYIYSSSYSGYYSAFAYNGNLTIIPHDVIGHGNGLYHPYWNFICSIDNNGNLGSLSHMPREYQPVKPIYDETTYRKYRYIVKNEGFGSSIIVSEIYKDGSLSSDTRTFKSPEPAATPSILIVNDNIIATSGNTVYQAKLSEDGSIGSWFRGVDSPVGTKYVIKGQVFLINNIIYRARFNKDDELYLWEPVVTLKGQTQSFVYNDLICLFDTLYPFISENGFQKKLRDNIIFQVQCADVLSDETKAKKEDQQKLNDRPMFQIDSEISAIFYHDMDSSKIYAYDRKYNIIAKSMDGAISWQNIKNMPQMQSFVSIPDKIDQFYVIDKSGKVFLATDNFSNISPTFTKLPNGILDIYPYSKDSSVIMATMPLGPYGQIYNKYDLYRSVDGGLNWLSRKNDLEINKIGGLCYLNDAKLINISYANIILATNDGGRTWNTVYTDKDYSIGYRQLFKTEEHLIYVRPKFDKNAIELLIFDYNLNLINTKYIDTDDCDFARNEYYKVSNTSGTILYQLRPGNCIKAAYFIDPKENISQIDLNQLQSGCFTQITGLAAPYNKLIGFSRGMFSEVKSHEKSSFGAGTQQVNQGVQVHTISGKLTENLLAFTTKMKYMGQEIAIDWTLRTTSQDGNKVIGVIFNPQSQASITQAYMFEGTFDGKVLNFVENIHLTAIPKNNIKPGDKINEESRTEIVLGGGKFSAKSFRNGKLSDQKITYRNMPVSKSILAKYDRDNQMVVGYVDKGQSRIVYTIEVKDGKPIPGTLKENEE